MVFLSLLRRACCSLLPHPLLLSCRPSSRSSVSLVSSLVSLSSPCARLRFALRREVSACCLRVSGGAPVASPRSRVPAAVRCRLAVVGPAPLRVVRSSSAGRPASRVGSGLVASLFSSPAVPAACLTHTCGFCVFFFLMVGTPCLFNGSPHHRLGGAWVAPRARRCHDFRAQRWLSSGRPLPLPPLGPSSPVRLRSALRRGFRRVVFIIRPAGLFFVQLVAMQRQRQHGGL